jgi:hypothetical protein
MFAELALDNSTVDKLAAVAASLASQAAVIAPIRPNVSLRLMVL